MCGVGVLGTYRLSLGWRRVCALSICFSLLYVSLLPHPPHQPTLFQTLQEHAAFMAEHGHAHGFDEDLADAIHGHTHDVLEHDHSVATLAVPPIAAQSVDFLSILRPPKTVAHPGRLYRIERPPRV